MSNKFIGHETEILFTWAQLFKTNDVVNVLLNFQKLISQICQYLSSDGGGGGL